MLNYNVCILYVLYDDKFEAYVLSLSHVHLQYLNEKSCYKTWGNIKYTLCSQPLLPTLVIKGLILVIKDKH